MCWEYLYFRCRNEGEIFMRKEDKYVDNCKLCASVKNDTADNLLLKDRKIEKIK